MEVAAGVLGRLTDSRGIAAVMRSGRQRPGRFVVVHAVVVHASGTATAASSIGTPPVGPRFAVIASRRVGNAVARNRAKRLLREAARQIDWRDDLQVVLVARRACARATTPLVRDELIVLARTLEVTRP